MYKKMLVPLDGSKLAEVVLPYAKELAGRLDLDLVFLYVCSPHESEALPVYQAYVEHAAEIVKLQSREVQHKTGAPSGSKVVETYAEVTVGYAAEEILRYVNEKGIDLILMATHGRSGIKRWAIGSNADKVLRASEVPVWLVGVGLSEDIVHDNWPYRTILIPLDGSPAAESVLPHVETLARQRGSKLVKEVVLLRVCEQYFIMADYPQAGMPLSLSEHVKRLTDHVRREAEQYLERIQQHLAHAGLKVTCEVLMGKPANEIIDYAHKNSPNLIVMATHGHSGISQGEYGRVAYKVLRGVSSSILMVRPHQSDWPQIKYREKV
jgi:nucleotide-binding universal stress UspA family protein